MGHLARMQTLPFTLLNLDERNDHMKTTSKIVEIVLMINTQEFTASLFCLGPLVFCFLFFFFCDSLAIVVIIRKLVERFDQLFSLAIAVQTGL